MPSRDRSCYLGSQEARREAFGADFAAIRRPRPVSLGSGERTLIGDDHLSSPG
jgi:hypothetical protein